LWNPPSGTLGRILSDTLNRVAALKPRRTALESAARRAPKAPSLVAVLRGKDVAIIAEVKRRSPSKGDINPTLEAAEQAREYEAGGARGISVLTEGAHFGGSPEDFEEVRAAVSVPLLKKDFHVDPLQLLEARVLRASALLLIARALNPALLIELASFAKDLGLEVLVEVRDERELEAALQTSAPLIGVNSRNLETLVMDPAVCERLIPLVPADRIAIYESGVKNRRDVDTAAKLGADAVLVGSVVSAATSPASAVRGLTGAARMARD
jgi:indole-3-glycerol phosphate synthase